MNYDSEKGNDVVIKALQTKKYPKCVNYLHECDKHFNHIDV